MKLGNQARAFLRKSRQESMNWHHIMKHLSQETEKGKELRCSLGAINIIIINFEKYSTTPVIKQVPILMQLLVGSERKKERTILAFARFCVFAGCYYKASSIGRTLITFGIRFVTYGPSCSRRILYLRLYKGWILHVLVLKIFKYTTISNIKVPRT